MNFPQKESPAGGQGFDHVGSGDQGSIYTEQASKARVAKPIPVVLVMTRATPAGSIVTVPGKVGGVSFGEVGQVLVEFMKLHFARQAARMGYQIAFITQSDGKEADWSLSVEALESWEASFGQGDD